MNIFNVYFKERIKDIKQIKKGYKFKDKFRLIIFFIFSLIPKRFPNRLMFLNKLVNGITISFLNKLFILYTFDGLLIIDKEYEKNISSWFNINRNSVFIDVGSNIGLYSILLANKVNHIFSFEPNEQTFNYLQKNINLNNAFNVTPFNFGLSNENKLIKMNVTNNSGQNSIILKKDKTIRQEQITVIKFDNIIKHFNIKEIELIKIDVEGYEWFVLDGMKETLIKYNPRLIIEVIKENELIVFDLLKNLNYQIKEQKEKNILAVKIGE